MNIIARKFSSWHFKPFRLAILTLVVVCLLTLIAYFEPAISTADVDGYFTPAELIVKHGRTGFESKSLLQFVGFHFFKAIGYSHFSLYPPGLPLILAIFSKPGDLKAALLVNPLLTSLAILAMFLLCRLWIGEMRSARGCGDGINSNKQSLCSDRKLTCSHGLFLYLGSVFSS
jgi:hypothetical protein